LASNLAAPKDIIGAGVGVVKGVLGTAVGIVGTVVEGGARLGNNGREASSDNALFLPPISLQGGPMRNILKNGLTDNIKMHFQRLGIKSPFGEDEKVSSSGARQRFVPLKAGDIVYLSANVHTPNRTTQKLYLSSTGTLNQDIGAVQVEEDEEPEDIYWCLFRIWYREDYTDWHVDDERGAYSVGEHGEYALESLNDFALQSARDKGMNEDSGMSVLDQIDFTSDGTSSKNEARYEEMVHGADGQRYVTYEKELIFEHVATGQVLASINDEGSLVDQDATKICLVDRVQASSGNLKNLIKKEKTQREYYFTIAPRFKSRVSGRVYDGDLVRVNGATSGGRLHFSGGHSVMDNLARVKVREANLSLFHKVLETQVQVRTELQKKAAHRRDSDGSIRAGGDSPKTRAASSPHNYSNARRSAHSHSHASLPSRGETVLTIKRFGKWTSPGQFLHYGDYVRFMNPEIDAYLWCGTGMHGAGGAESKEAYFRRVRHSSSSGSGLEGDLHVSKVITACKSIFMIEGLDKLKGGPVHWGDTLRLKHLVTGKYLHVSSSPLKDDDDDEGRKPKRPSRLFSDWRSSELQKQKQRDFKLTLVDFSIANTGEGMERSEGVGEDQKWIGSLFEFNPVNGRDLDASNSNAEGSKKKGLMYAKDCFAMLSHSFVSKDVEVNSGDEDEDALDKGKQSTERCFLHAGARKKPRKQLFLHSIFDSCRGASLPQYSKFEFGNTSEIPRPPPSSIASFSDVYYDVDACKIEVVGWRELQGVMFALSCVKVAQSYMARVSAFANRREQDEIMAGFSEEHTERVLKMLSDVSRFASGKAVFPNEVREDMESDGGIQELDVLERKAAASCVIQGTKLVDALFAMLAAPRHAGLSSQHIHREEKLGRIQRAIAETLTVATDDHTCQIYVAMQYFTDGPYKNTGYLAELREQMSWSFGAAKLLDCIVTNNKVLTHKLVNERLVEFFISSLSRQGPARPTLDFLTSINLCYSENRDTEPVVHCQETLCRLLFPTFGYSDAEREKIEKRKHNRRSVLIETALACDRSMNPDFEKSLNTLFDPSCKTSPHKNRRLSAAPQRHGFQLMVSWEGMDMYQPGTEEALENHALYYSYKALFGSKKDAFDDSDPTSSWYINSRSWNEYQRAFFDEGELPKRKWVNLSDFMWTVDPEAYHGAVKWSEHRAKIKTNPNAMKKFKRAQKLAFYYLGILHLFTNMCKHRSNRVISHLEKQFSYETLLTGISDTNLPKLARAALADLLQALYLDRYPHETILLPRVVRSYNVAEVEVEKDCSRSCDDCIPAFYRETEANIELKSTSSIRSINPDEVEEEIEITVPVNLRSKDLTSEFLSSQNSIMADQSNGKFSSLQDVIIRSLRRSAMADQVPPAAKRSEAKKVADDVHFTLSLLYMSKRLLFSGFYCSVESFNELLLTAVKLLKKPTMGAAAPKRSFQTGRSFGKFLGKGKSIVSSGIQMMERPSMETEESQKNDMDGVRAVIQRHDEADSLIAKYRDGEDTEEVERKIGKDLFRHLKSFDLEVKRSSNPEFVVKDVILERQRQVLGRWSANNIIGNEAQKMEAPQHMQVLTFETGVKIAKAAEEWDEEAKEAHSYKEISGLTPLLCSDTNPEVDLLPTPHSLWEYRTPWQLADEVDGVVSKDAHKWCYSFNWPQEGEQLFARTKWWARNNPGSFVRIRKWVRERLRVSAVELAVKYSFKLDKIAISEAFRKCALSNPKRKGVIDVELAAELMDAAYESRIKEDSGNSNRDERKVEQSDLTSISEDGEKESTLAHELRRSRLDTVDCRIAVCDMLMFAAGAALDSRITKVAGKIKYAIMHDTTLYMADSPIAKAKFFKDSERNNPGVLGVGDMKSARVDKSIVGTRMMNEAVVHGILLKGKWAKQKDPLILTMAGMNMFDSLFKHSKGKESISNFDLSDPTDSSTAGTLLGCLVTEESGVLVEKILCTLFLHHSRKSLLVHRLSELHFLMDTKSLQLHQRILKNLAVLRNNVNSFYSWGQGTGATSEDFFDFESRTERSSSAGRRTSTDAQALNNVSRSVLKQTLEIISELTKACSLPKTTRRMSVTTVMPEDDSGVMLVPALERQTMMRKLEVHMVFIELLEIKDDHADDYGQTIILKKLQSAGNDFLTAFMEGNVNNKLEIIRTGAIQTFLSHVGKGRGISRVLASIFKDSGRLVRDVPRSILLDFASHIQAWEHNLRNLFFYMDFFRNLLVVKGVPMRRNQTMVMNVFTDQAFNNLLVTYASTMKGGEKLSSSSRTHVQMLDGSLVHCELSGPAIKRKDLLLEFAERKELDKSFDNILLSQGLDKATGESMKDCERKLYYHARVIELLGLCCTGNVDTTELTAARTVPFAEIRAFFKDPDYAEAAPFLWTAFTKFATNVYFDTDASSSMTSEGRMRDMTAAWDVVNMIALGVASYTAELKSLSEASYEFRKNSVIGGKHSNGVTRRAVLRECIIAGVLSAESFYSCVERDYSVTMASATSIGGSNTRESLAAKATLNFQSSLRQLCVVSFDAGWDAEEKRILSETCVTLNVYPEAGFTVGASTSPTKHDSNVASRSFLSHRSSTYDIDRADAEAPSVAPSVAPRIVSNPVQNPQETVQDHEHPETAREKKSKFAWAVQSSEYVNKQLVAEFDQLTKLVLNFGKFASGDTQDENKTSGVKGRGHKAKAMKKDKRVKMSDRSYNTNQHFDTLIKRLVEHVRRLVAGLIRGQERYNMSSGEKNGGLLTNCLLGFRSSAPLVLRLLRSCVTHADWMWPNDFGYTDPEKIKKLDKMKIEAMQDVMVRCGAAELIVDLISGLSSGENESHQEGETTSAANTEYVKEEALRFAIVLLDGGNREVQDKIYGYLAINAQAANKFFSGIFGRIAKANWCSTSIRRWIEYKMGAEGDITEEEREGINELSTQKTDLKIGLIFRMLQLLAEGHNMQMQRLLQDQSILGLTKSRGLVRAGADLVSNSAFAVEAIERMEAEGLQELIQLFDFLTECVQGPCAPNQKLLSQTLIGDAVQIILSVKVVRRKTLPTKAEGQGDESSSTHDDDPALQSQRTIDQRNDLLRKLMLSAMRTLNSMLEGRAENYSCPVHTYLCQKMSPAVLISRTVVAYQSYRESKRLANSGMKMIGLSSVPFLKMFVGALERLAQKQKIKDVKEYYREQTDNAFMIGVEITMLMIRLSHLDPKFNPVVVADASIMVSSQVHRGLIAKLYEILFGEHVSTGEDEEDEDNIFSSMVDDVNGNTDDKEGSQQLARMLEDPTYAKEVEAKSKKVQQMKQKRLYMQKRALAFFRDKLRSVEVCWGSDGLSSVYFPIPKEGEHMSDEIFEDLVERLDYSSDDRVKELMKLVPEVYDELKWHSTLQKAVGEVLAQGSTNQLNNVTFLIAMIINFLLLISLKFETGSESPSYANEKLENYTFVLGTVNANLAIFKLIHIAVFKLPILYKKMKRVRKRAKFFGGISFAQKRRALLSALFKPIAFATLIYLATHVCTVAYGTDTFNTGSVPYYLQIVTYFMNAWIGLSSVNAVAVNVGYSTKFLFWYSLLWQSQGVLGFYGLMLASAILGTRYSRTYPLFYAVQLFTIVPMSPTLNAVIMSVTKNGHQLVMTSILGLIIIYAFSLIAFFFLHSTNDLYNSGDAYQECTTMVDCYKTFVRNGLIYGGGIGDYVSGDLDNAPSMGDDMHYWTRLAFDLSFFIIVIVLLLNMIFGIILDTFGAVREAQNERKELAANRCFICGLNKDIFEDQKQLGGKGFHYHRENEHNLFDYIYFVIYLKNKSETEYNGAETFVSEQVNKEDTSWIPDGIALQIPRVDLNREREKKLEDLFESLRERQAMTREVLAGEISRLSAGMDKQFDIFRRTLGRVKSEVKEVRQTQREDNKKK